MFTTFKEFQQIPEDSIFRVVITAWHNELGTPGTQEFIFVCKKGGGHHDWAIYYGPAQHGVHWAKTNGEKLTIESNIRSIFPCDQETFDRYRF